ncbi:MAG: serine acetyltransferase [Planctomycetes bacterium]|nr:serine acetyltransferase [Planctomycetota bacterium]
MGALLDLLRMDLAWYNIVNREPVPVSWGWGRVLFAVWHIPPFRAVLLYRLASRAWERKHHWLAVLIVRHISRRFGSDISYKARIGGGLRLPHPRDVVIGAGVEVGQYAVIGQHVTLGGNFGRRDDTGRMYPRIGDRCWICAGAVVAGPITVGKYVLVGANAVVVRDVPDYVIVGGVPARILRTENPERNWTRGTIADRKPLSGTADAGND